MPITITGTGSPIPSADCAGPGVLVQSGSTALQIVTVVAPAGPSVTFLEHMLDPWQDDLEVRALHTGGPAWTRCSHLDKTSLECLIPIGYAA